MTTEAAPLPTLTLSERLQPSCCKHMAEARRSGTIMLFGIDTANYRQFVNQAGKYYISSHPREFDYTYEQPLTYCPWCTTKL